jgi:hypothetical protein
MNRQQIGRYDEAAGETLRFPSWSPRFGERAEQQGSKEDVMLEFGRL